MHIKKMALVLSVLLLLSVCLNAQVKRPRQAVPSVINGKKIYTEICIACHMADGGGVPHMNPPLIKTTYVLGDKATLIKIVLNGFKEDVEINGETYANNMTPHGELKDEQIADVLTYVRKSFGNNAGRVTASEVKKVRAANK